MAAARAKITFFCRQDFANVSSEIAHALREYSPRYEARVIAVDPHPYGYALAHDYDLTRATPAMIRSASTFLEGSTTVVWAEEANAIGGSFSAYGQGDMLGALFSIGQTKRRLVFHAGVAYRAAHARYNPLDERAFAGQLCSPDLLRLALPKARCVWGKPMITDLDKVDRLWTERRAAGKIVVTHSPSSHALKGTAMIRRVMAHVERAHPRVEYRELGGPVRAHLAHTELMRARDEAVLHIDQYHPGIGGAGIASFEAMTRGVIPLASTNQIIDGAYEQWALDRASFPLVPMVFDGQNEASERDTERSLVRIVSNVVRLPLEELEARGRAAALWAHRHLSPSAYVGLWEKQLDALDGTPPLRQAC